MFVNNWGEGVKIRFFERIGSVLWLVVSYLWLFPQLIWAGWKISRLNHPIVTIFGGKMVEEGHYVTQARDLARCLAENGISIVTGGGPGIMEAANHGAHDAGNGTRTMGVGVRGINTEEPVNPYVTDYIVTDFFYLRKHLLIYYSHAFVVFPGGFGTLDELFEVVMLMQTKKLPVMPVVLVGKEYWSGLLIWMNDAVRERIVSIEHAKLVVITDDIDEAARLVVGHCKSPQCSKWRHKKIF